MFRFFPGEPAVGPFDGCRNYFRKREVEKLKIERSSLFLFRFGGAPLADGASLTLSYFCHAHALFLLTLISPMRLPTLKFAFPKPVRIPRSRGELRAIARLALLAKLALEQLAGLSQAEALRRERVSPATYWRLRGLFKEAGYCWKSLVPGVSTGRPRTNPRKPKRARGVLEVRLAPKNLPSGLLIEVKSKLA